MKVMDYTVGNVNVNYDESTHKPRIYFNAELECYQCTDGGLTLFGNSAIEAYQELMSVR